VRNREERARSRNQTNWDSNVSKSDAVGAGARERARLRGPDKVCHKHAIKRCADWVDWEATGHRWHLTGCGVNTPATSTKPDLPSR